MQKKRLKKGALSVAIIMSLSLTLAGCGFKKEEAKLDTGEISANSVVMLVGDEQVRFSEVADYCYFLKCQYESSFGSDLWNYQVEESETIGDQAKQEIVNMITQLKIISAQAQKQGVTLTADEEDEAARQAEDLVGAASGEDKKKYSLNVQEISEIYQENALANKMFYVATDDVDTDISDEEARQVKLQVIQVKTAGQDENGNTVPADSATIKAAKKRADKLYEQAQDTEDFLALAQKSSDSTRYEFTVGSDSEELEQAVITAAFSLTTGEISQVVEGEQGYYIVYCVDEMDEEATQAKKEEIISQRQTKAFTEKYAQWMQDMKVDINQSFWNDFSIS